MRRPLYLQIMDEVRRALVVGTLRAEDPLPSVRELASQLVVNPRTVLQAYRELEREGVLYVRRGQGTFVAPDARADRQRPRPRRGETGAARGAAQRAGRGGAGQGDSESGGRRKRKRAACCRRATREAGSAENERRRRGGHPRAVEAIRPRDRARRRRPSRSRRRRVRPGRRERRGQEHHAQGADEPGARGRRHRGDPRPRHGSPRPRGARAGGLRVRSGTITATAG